MAFTIPSSDEALAPTVQSQIFETDLSILVAALSQTGVVSGCGVTAQGSPDMTVAVASGTILAAGVSVAVTSGNLTVGAADATNPRVDLISASAAGVKTITAGAAAAVASVKPPDLPSGHIGLAFVYVAATDTAINTNEITDKRCVLVSTAGGYAQSYLGYNTIGASNEVVTNSVIYAKQITPGADSLLLSVGAYIKGNGTNASSFGAAVYSDNSGTPLRVLAAVPWPTNAGTPLTNAFFSATSRWVDVPLSLPLVSGTTYHIAFYASDGGGGGNGAINIAYDAGSDKTLSTPYVNDQGAGSFSNASRKYSIRASVLT